MKRNVNLILDFIQTAESSVLIEVGNTKVICNVTIEEGVPPFMKDSGKGWITAEYSMLPRSTKTRTRRESIVGKISGRTAEIQRLIGRSLRSVVNLNKFNGYTATIDCDVIQADGGTRVASITGAAVALYIAFERLLKENKLSENPMQELIAAVSVGIHNDEIIVDLDYELDSTAQVDMNIVMTESGKFVEIQGTGEESSFSKQQLDAMLEAGETAIRELIKKQRQLMN
jgi:ribonuclease PH